MPTQSASTENKVRRRRNATWLNRKISHIRQSRRAQKQLQQVVVIIIAVLIAFVLGFYFLGPSFSSSGE